MPLIDNQEENIDLNPQGNHYALNRQSRRKRC
jgi:hypothetical protein